MQNDEDTHGSTSTTDILARYVSKKSQNREDHGDETRAMRRTLIHGIFAKNIELWKP